MLSHLGLLDCAFVAVLLFERDLVILSQHTLQRSIHLQFFQSPFLPAVVVVSFR